MGKSVVIIQLTEEEKSDLFRMRSEGCTMREISEYIGCSISTINYHLTRAGLSNRHRWTQEEDASLARMYNDGMTSTEIGEKLNRSKSNVQHRIYYLRKLGKRIIYHK